MRVPYSRLPVYQGSYDNVIGFVHIRDLLDPARTNRPLTVGQVSRHVKFMPNSKTVLAALSEMRRERAHLAIVVDEYGGTAGIVTLEDLVEELIGDIRDEYDVDQDRPRRLRTGEVEVDGLLNLHEFEEQTGIELPEGPYETAAGFVLAGLGEVPQVGNSVEVDGQRITVTEMDGRRIARLRIAPAARPETPEPTPSPTQAPFGQPTPQAPAHPAHPAGPAHHPGPARPVHHTGPARLPDPSGPNRLLTPARPTGPASPRRPARLSGLSRRAGTGAEPAQRPGQRAGLGAPAQHVGRPGLMP